MSNDTSQNGGASDASPRDASLKVDPDALSSEEAEFARQMGFGDDGNEAGEQVPSAPAAPSNEDASAVDTEAGGTEASEADTDPVPAGTAAPADAGPDASAEPAAKPDTTGPVVDEAPPEGAEPAEPRVESEPDAGKSPATDAREATDWDEIHPRPASEGIQPTLEARADALLQSELSGLGGPPAAREGTALPDPASETGNERPDETLGALERRCADLEKKLGARDLELERLRTSFSQELGARDRDDKQLDQLHAEIESLCLERDQLIDQLAVLSGELAQARSHSEKLEASLRAARGALTPLPEGERALRAEVVGLRGRLEDLEAENQHLTGRISSFETELAIERAKVEDRQQEVCGLLEMEKTLEARLAENEQTVENALARQREMLALTTRLQEENDELRAAQLALQETLQARDLEIAAREEHLAVTKRGLASRDREILELEERLRESERAREALKTDLQRLTLDQQELTGKLARRETRIATLTRTLARVEEVIGHPISPADPAARPLPRAEWTHAGPADRAREPAIPPSTSAGHEAGSSETESAGDENDDPDPAPEASSETLPALLGLWRDRRFSELLGRPGTGSTADFFADCLIEAFGPSPPGGFRLKSLGGDGIDAEIQLATALEKRGDGSVSIRVLDRDPARAHRRRQAIERAGLGGSIEVVASCDPEDWSEDPACNAILLADALCGIPDSRSFLDDLAPIVAKGALILFVDRIASGPVRLSASARMRLEEVWPMLPEGPAACEALAPLPRCGESGGFPDEGDDPGTAIRERFHARVIAGFGHLIDLLVGSRRGSALPADHDAVVALLDAVMEIEENRSRIEDLPPRHGLAVFGPETSDPPLILGRDWPGTSAEGKNAD